MRDPKEILREILSRELGSCEDNVRRHMMQLERMPYDHDTRDSLERAKVWKAEINLVISKFL